MITMINKMLVDSINLSEKAKLVDQKVGLNKS